MSDKSDGTKAGHFKCPCATCILTEAQKLEEKRKYKEADLVIRNGLEYYKSMSEQLETELKNFHVRTKYGDSTASVEVAHSEGKPLGLIQLTQCQQSSHRSVTRTKEFTCPVAIFERNPDPSQKPMYPKNVVYLNGNDNQLEEIRAARYWTKNESRSSQEHAKISDNLRNIISSEQFISFVRNGETQTEALPRNPADITNVIESVHSSNTKLQPPNKTKEIENIDPNAPEILGNPKDSTMHVSKIVLNEQAVRVPQATNTLKNIAVRSPTPTIPSNMEKSSISPAERRISSKGEASVPSAEKNSSDLLGNQRKNVNSLRNAETSSPKVTLSRSEAVVCNESTSCDSSEEVPMKSKLSLTIASVTSNTEENKSCTEKLTSLVNSNVCPGGSIETVDRNTLVRTKIPTIKKCIPQIEHFRAEAPSSKAVTESACSKTFVVAKPNPSETFVIKAFDIDKETLTLVPDEDDDFDPYVPKKRTTQLFKSVDMDSSTTEAFYMALPSSTPNKRMSKFFSSDIDSNEVYQVASTAPTSNLSTITEISKERYSTSYRPSQKTPLETINETEQSDGSSKSDSMNVIPNPFDVNFIEHLLQKIQFPRPEHINGYNKINCDMAQLKLSSVVKLGNNKYNIIGEIGKGSYARILRLQEVKEPIRSIALKQQKPACPWEFYISKEIQRRLCTDLEKSYFIQYSEIFVYRNGSAMISEWAPYGSILNFVNSLKTSPYHNKRCPLAVAMWLSIQLVEGIQYLHTCHIIHGDVKPDNFVIYDEIATDRACVKLIDYGRAIDMTLLPKNAVFTKVVTTEDYACNEMKDNRPWTYQTDLFGLASTIYLLLVGEYMKTKKEPSKKWTLAKNLPRYINREQWNPIFDLLLNIPSCTELPDLKKIRQTLEANFNSLDRPTITQQFTSIGNLLKK